MAAESGSNSAVHCRAVAKRKRTFLVREHDVAHQLPRRREELDERLGIRLAALDLQARCALRECYFVSSKARPAIAPHSGVGGEGVWVLKTRDKSL